VRRGATASPDQTVPSRFISEYRFVIHVTYKRRLWQKCARPALPGSAALLRHRAGHSPSYCHWFKSCPGRKEGIAAEVGRNHSDSERTFSEVPASDRFLVLG
jgi:RNase P subunit RPR2